MQFNCSLDDVTFMAGQLNAFILKKEKLVLEGRTQERDKGKKGQEVVL